MQKMGGGGETQIHFLLYGAAESWSSKTTAVNNGDFENITFLAIPSPIQSSQNGFQQMNVP